MHTRNRIVPVITLLVALSGCAGVGQVVSAPGVSLRNVEATDLDFAGQTFLLSFDVTNPNPFPLPIASIEYGIELDGHRFAGGKAASAFSVPARSDGEFSISVELDLLRTAPQLLFIVRDGVERDIPYALEGKFGIDLPYVKPVRFSAAGEIRMTPAGFRARLP
jgi:LEA14-like dessication related protein